jgi:hypothetical protein
MVDETLKYTYRFKIPNPEKDIAKFRDELVAIEASLKSLISSGDEQVASDLKKQIDALRVAVDDIHGYAVSSNQSQLLANGIFDEAINSIEQKISEIDAAYANREELAKNIINTDTLLEATGSLANQMLGLIGDIKSLSSRLDAALLLKADKSSLDALNSRIDSIKLPEVPDIVADSNNVTITKRNGEVGIAVSVPAVAREVIRAGGGGISKAAVVKLIEEYSPTGEVTKIFGYNVDDQLILISDSKGTKTFTYDSEDKLINIVGTGSYSSKNFHYDLSDKLISIEVI